MNNFQIIKGNSNNLNEIKVFLQRQGISKANIQKKFKSLQKNVNEQCFGVGRNSQNKIIGVAQIFVQYKFTRGLSKVCHIENVWISKDINNMLLKKNIRIKIEQSVGQYSKKQECYKMILCQTQKNNYSIHQKAGMKTDQVYMEIGNGGVVAPKL